MNFEYSENQQMIAQTVKDFAEKYIRPYVMEWDETQHFPVETMHKLGELGLLGILIPEEYGGAGLSYNEYITALIELGKVDSALTLSVAAHNSLCTNHIYKFGNDEQRKRWSNTIGLVALFGSLFGRPKAQVKATSTTEPSSSTEKQPKPCLLDTLCKTRTERLRQQQCSSSDGPPKSRRTKKISGNSKPSAKGSKTATSRKKNKNG